MTRLEVALVLAVVLAVVGVTSVLLSRDLVQRIVAINVASGGVMMLLLVLASPDDPAGPDPVPHALVITGIVIMVAVTGLALGMARRAEGSDTGDGGPEAASAGEADPRAGPAAADDVDQPSDGQDPP